MVGRTDENLRVKRHCSIETMTESVWSDVDHHICDHLLPADPVLEAALAASAAAGLPEINVTPNQGKLLHLLARIHGAKRILEIGTLGGYSTIWLARALPADGRVVTLEFERHHAEVARANFERAGLSEQIDIRVGSALDLLPQIAAEQLPPFDLVFIDADKCSTAEYFEWGLKLSRVGGVIVADNVVRQGAVVDTRTTDEHVLGVRRFYERVAAEPRVTATAVQTVGSKGHDGFAVALIVA